MARTPRKKPGEAAQTREAVRALTPLALETLADIMRASASETARLAAAREILDRAHGKASKTTDSEQEPGGVTVVIRRFGEDAPGEQD